MNANILEMSLLDLSKAIEKLAESIEFSAALKSMTIAKNMKLVGVSVPPHSIEAEQSILGGLMLDNNSWDKIADRIVESDFYRQDHRVIFNAMSSLVNRQQPLDTLTLAETLKEQNKIDKIGGEVYLFNLAKSTPGTTNITAYADIVREHSFLRKLNEYTDKFLSGDMTTLKEFYSMAREVFSKTKFVQRTSNNADPFKGAI